MEERRGMGRGCVLCMFSCTVDVCAFIYVCMHLHMRLYPVPSRNIPMKMNQFRPYVDACSGISLRGGGEGRGGARVLPDLGFAILLILARRKGKAPSPSRSKGKTPRPLPP